MEERMRKFSALILFFLLSASISFAQAKSAAKPAPKAAAAAHPKAILETTAGTITCELFPQKAPMTVANFVGLAEGTKDWTNPASKVKKHNTPLYNGTIFHRIVPGFMIQGGDPMGNGAGDPGYSFKDEFSDLTFDRPGRLAMANSGPNTNGSQFFITVAPTPHLNGKHTIFGQCGPMAVINKIANAPAMVNPANDEKSKPINPVRLTKVTIVKPSATK
jgi:cyclophilin family peptidyl-prolyl cis-trans isomerase